MENGTANANIISGWLSIGNDTTSPGKPLVKQQEEREIIIDDPILIVRNEPIIENNYTYTLDELIATQQHICKCFDKILLRFTYHNWKAPGNM